MQATLPSNEPSAETSMPLADLKGRLMTKTTGTENKGPEPFGRSEQRVIVDTRVEAQTHIRSR
jgi:hypothetical protein